MKKSLEQRKQSRSMGEHVDSLSNVTTKAVKRKKKEEALRKTPENAKLEMEKAVERKKKDETLRKKQKKLKLHRTKPQEEQNIGESNVELKQRKTNKNKTTKPTQDDISNTKKARKAETVEHLPTKDKTKKARKAETPSKGDQDSHIEKNEDEDEAYQIPSEDETSQGMTKWITDYYQSRPGLNALQEKIDEFITAHEEQEEQARIEKEEQAAEGGWTVVVHHKGRKKTTDAESGTAVGSVSQAAVMDKIATKKDKDVGLDFYRFQKREAKRNEIIMLRSKFEQDKKRMQELRAQRKFRPY